MERMLTARQGPRQSSSAHLLHYNLLTEGLIRNTGYMRVDRDQGIIYGVKILGRYSSNGLEDDPEIIAREYTTQALRRAMPLYEGIHVNINHPHHEHPNQERSSEDRFGKLVNVRINDEGIYADLHYLKTHPMAERLAEAAERMPDAFGLSHNASGTGQRRGKTFYITEIKDVRSVDIVADAGTVKSLFEDQNTNGKGKAMRKKKKLLEMGDLDMKDKLSEDDDADMDDTDMDYDGEADAGDLKSHAASMIEAILKDEELDYDTMKEKILKVLGIFDDSADDELEDGEDVEEEDELGEAEDELEEEEEEEKDEDKKKDANESRHYRRQPNKVKHLREMLDQYQVKERLRRRRAVCIKLCERAHLPREACTKVFLEALMQADGETARKLIDDRRRLAAVRVPRSFSTGNGMPALDAKDFSKQLKIGS